MRLGKHRSPSGGLEFEFVRSDGGVELLVPLADMDGQVVCWVCFGYRVTDPLVTEISIRSPSKAPVVERSLLRSDLRRFARTDGEIPGLSIERRPDGEHLIVSFYEGDLAIPVVIPATAVAAYLSETEELVSFDPRDEARALDRAFMELLRGSAPRT